MRTNLNWKTIDYYKANGERKTLDLALVFLYEDDNIEDGYGIAEKKGLKKCPEEDIHQIIEILGTCFADLLYSEYSPPVISTTKENHCYVAGDHTCLDLNLIRPASLLSARYMIFCLSEDIPETFNILDCLSDDDDWV